MLKKRQNWTEVELIKLPGGKPLRPISLLRRTLAPQTIVPAHRHAWGQLLYAYEGVLDITTPTGHYIVPPHRAVWVPPDNPHEVSSLHGAEISSIYITTEETDSLGNECYVLEVSALLRELIMAAVQQPINYEGSSKASRLFQTLRDQITTANRVPLYLPLPSDPRLLKIYYQLYDCPDCKWTLEQWGSYVGASDRTLQRLFKKETGLNFRSWRQQLRLQIALLRLVNSRESITNIANDLGYESSSAFIFMFQQQLGVTPGEYIKSLDRKI